ncbi:MAG: hypothetical protein QM706_18010, partial [Nitrospira sp.]
IGKLSAGNFRLGRFAKRLAKPQTKYDCENQESNENKNSQSDHPLPYPTHNIWVGIQAEADQPTQKH